MRAEHLQELVNRLVRASVRNWAHRGDYATDATLVWAWDPPRRRGGKIERRGRDGDAGRPVPMSDIVQLEDAQSGDLEQLGLLDDAIQRLRSVHGLSSLTIAAASTVPAAPSQDPFGPLPGTTPASSAYGRKRSKEVRPKPKTWGAGAAWVGRTKNKTKVVYGYALHTVAVSDPEFPAVVEALAVTPAPALPAPSVMPLLRMLHDQRVQDPAVQDLMSDGRARPLGHITADPLYTASASRWQLPIRDLGGDAIFRIHSTIQGGRRMVRGTTFVDGRPYCDCLPQGPAALRYPTFPYTKERLDAYEMERVKRDGFEMKPNGDYLPTGSRQFKYPHWTKTTRGGCEHCVDMNGNAVVDPATGRAKPRCCARPTKTFKREELGLYQPVPHGSEQWHQLWNPRNRVEGGYGVIKNLALVNWGHGYHHFVGLARESLVAAFAVMAMNFHLQRTWDVRAKLVTEKVGPKRTLPPAIPTQTTPQGTATARREREAAEREAARRRGPKGLEILGTTPAAP